MKYLLFRAQFFILFGVFQALGFRAEAQDILFFRNGEQQKTKIVRINKSDVDYKKYEDPEFSTYTISKKELSKIQLQSGKVIDLDKLFYPYLSLNFGPSIPTADYARFNPIAPEDGDIYSTSGYAKTGFKTGLEMGRYFTRRFGWIARAELLLHKYDVYSFANIFSDFGQVEVTPEKDGLFWKNINIHIGPQYSFAIRRKLAVNLRATWGLSMVSKPFIDLSLPFDRYATFDTPSEITFKNFTCGLSFRYPLGDKFSLQANADLYALFVSMQTQYDLFEITNNQSQNIDSNPGLRENYFMPSLNTTLGLAYRLTSK